MKTRRLGPKGPEVSAIGLGCMGMAAFYGQGLDEDQATAVIHRALDLGITLFDTAEMYGPHTNEVQVGRALADRREKAFVATKFGIGYNADRTAMKVDGSPANVRRAIEGSLKRLNMDHVDLYYLHRVDPDTPIEETVGAMAELVTEGKVRFLGLSEAAPEPIPGGERPMHGFEQLTFAPLDRKLIDVAALTQGERDYVDAYHAETLAKVGPLLDGEALDWAKAACAPL